MPLFLPVTRLAFSIAILREFAARTFSERISLSSFMAIEASYNGLEDGNNLFIPR
jgi:hypothetical protein